MLKRDRASCAHPPAGTATPAHGTNGPEVGDVHENRSIGPRRAPDTAPDHRGGGRCAEGARLGGFRVDDLVDSALLATYSEGVETTIRFVHDVLASATTFEGFREGIFTANGMTDPRAVDQQRLTDDYATAIISAQEKGWVRKSVDPLALAVFVQAYSFGVTVDDVSATHLGPDRWIAVIEDYFRSCVFEPDAHVRP